MNTSLKDLPVPKYNQRKKSSREVSWAPKEITRVHYMDSLFDKKFLDDYFDSGKKEKSIHTEVLKK